MFGVLFRRAQDTVDNAISVAVNRALVVIPFLVATAFAVAALAFRLNREYGPETANLMLAGLFVVVGIIAAIVVQLRTPHSAAASITPTTTSSDDVTPDATAGAPTGIFASVADQLSKTDRDLLMAALTSAAPIALPNLVKLVLRNLPLIVAIAAALFVLSRGSDTSDEAVPAEAAAA